MLINLYLYTKLYRHKKTTALSRLNNIMQREKKENIFQ